jgi:Rrf2 family protein
MISQTTKYALMTLGFLADHPGQWVQGSQIAEATRIPANYLSKILNQLRKRGYLESQKGWGGGFLLKEQALAQPIGRILELFEGSQEPRQCVFGLRACDDAHPCALHSRWTRVQNEYDTLLEKTTVADLRSGLQPQAG